VYGTAMLDDEGAPGVDAARDTAAGAVDYD